MECEIRGMADAKPRVSDTLPRRGRVNEVCREWVVHEDEALAYRLQKQEVETHYVRNKERNALVREDFPKAKEEQEKEMAEAAEKYRQMVERQEQIDSTYARRVAEKLRRDELERLKRVPMTVEETAGETLLTLETNGNTNCENNDSQISSNETSSLLPDVNKVGLPIVEEVRTFSPVVKHYASVAVTHNLRNLRLSAANENYASEVVKSSLEPRCVPYSNNIGTACAPTPATLLPEELKDILTDVDLQEEANRRLQEEKDAELARLLQKQEEEIFHEEIDRDRMVAIEAQDKELAKLLYEKEKSKLRRAKERARQKSLLKKQQSENADGLALSAEEGAWPEAVAISMPNKRSSCNVDPSSNGNHSLATDETEDDSNNGSQSVAVATRPSQSHVGTPSTNVAVHIDPTYLPQHQSSTMPNSLIFQDADAAPPYMPIQGQRRYQTSAEKKMKKSKSKDGLKYSVTVEYGVISSMYGCSLIYESHSTESSILNLRMLGNPATYGMDSKLSRFSSSNLTSVVSRLQSKWARPNRILSSSEGAPLLKSRTGHLRLLPPENFSKYICDVINFENLLESTDNEIRVQFVPIRKIGDEKTLKNFEKNPQTYFNICEMRRIV